jgi:putative ABC transport system permease protein
MLVSLTLAITIVSGISLFTDRLEQALSTQTEEFLGGNLKFESNKNKLHPLLKDLDITDSQFMEMALFASVIFSDKEMQLSSVKAVDKSYPLIGSLELKNSEGVYSTKSNPKPGTVWMDERLQNLLKVDYGDEVYIGDRSFIFTDTINYEPDRASGNFSFAPKTIMNMSDLESTQIIQPGSRVEYNYLFTGPENEILSIRNFLKDIKENGDEIEMLDEDSSSLGRAVDRSENFFLLGGLIAVLLSACTIGIASQRFTRRHISYVAILKTLGMKTLHIRALYFLIFFYTTILTLIFGLFFGWLLQNNFINIMSTYFPTELPSPGLYPLVVTCLTAFICQFGFIYPHILKLLSISPMRVIKDDIGLNQGSVSVISAGLLAFFVLLYLYTNQITLSLIIFLGVIGFSFVGIGSIYLLLGSKRLGLGASSPFNLALSELRRRKLGNSFQIFAFTVAIGLSLITFSASKNLLGSWQNSIPEDSPNNFAINITKEDKGQMELFLKENNIKATTFFPVANASISKIEVDEEIQIDRNFNITWIYNLPEQNQVLEGEWFSDEIENGISVSDEISERYNLSVGDLVYLKVEDRDIKTFVQSIRTINWDNFSPNFFVIGHPSLFKDIPSTFITSFYIPKEKQENAAELMREFRTISVFSIEELIKQVKEIIDQVTKALNSILLLTCLSAIFLALSALQDGFSVRRHQSAILRTLGASNSLIKNSALIEFALLGLISGILGALMSYSGVYFIETEVFQTAANFYPELFVLGPAIGLIVVSGLCFYLINGIVKKSPKELFT